MQKYRDPDWLHREYVEKGRNLTDIAEELDVHPSTISKWRQRLDIKKPSQKKLLHCPICGESFHRYVNRIKRAKHTNVCSRRCMYEARRQGLLDWTNSIIQGDARSMDAIPNDSIELIVTSPPYNVGTDYEAIDDNRSLEGYKTFLREALKECTRVLREDGGRLFLVIAGFGHGSDHIPANKLAIEVATSVGLNLRRELIWQKSVSAGRSSVYGSYKSASSPAFYANHESLLIFYSDTFRRPDDGEDTISKAEFLKATDSVWEIPSSSGSRIGHPAPFPEKFAPPGDRDIELQRRRGAGPLPRERNHCGRGPAN